jgi:uncharacterized membrane protein YgcG
MTAFNGSPAEMPISRGQTERLSPDEATAERLLSGHGADPCAPPHEQALALVLAAAARPATIRELRGEQAAVAAFEFAVRQSRLGARRRTGHLAGRNGLRCPGWVRGRRPGRVSGLITGGVLALVAALGGTAAADALPAPLQEVAHTVFGAPAPHPVAPRPSVSPGSAPAGSGPNRFASARPAPTPTPGANAGKTPSAEAKDHKNASGATSTPSGGNDQGNGNGNGNGNGHSRSGGNGGNGNDGSGNGGNGGGKSNGQGKCPANGKGPCG